MRFIQSFIMTAFITTVFVIQGHAILALVPFTTLHLNTQSMSKSMLIYDAAKKEHTITALNIKQYEDSLKKVSQKCTELQKQYNESKDKYKEQLQHASSHSSRASQTLNSIWSSGIQIKEKFNTCMLKDLPLAQHNLQNAKNIERAAYYRLEAAKIVVDQEAKTTTQPFQTETTKEPSYLIETKPTIVHSPSAHDADAYRHTTKSSLINLEP
jgi:hypothetical protein